MGNYIRSNQEAGHYAYQAQNAQTQGELSRKQAYNNAYKMEFDSGAAGYIAGDRMMTERQNAVAAVAQRRAENAASGFSASSGSKLRAEQSFAEMAEAMIANIGKDYTISDQNARNQANQLRKEGDEAAALGAVNSAYYSRMSGISSRAARGYLLGDTLSTLGDLGLRYRWTNLGKAATSNTGK